MINKIKYFLNLLIQIKQLPVAYLNFSLDVNPENAKLMYQHFTKRHEKYKIFKNKSLGAALIDLSSFRTHEEYIERINGRNAGAHKAKKAKSHGYYLIEINQNNYIDEIHEINTSIENRQGRAMDLCYMEKKTEYELLTNFKYYGVLNCDGKLMAYSTLGFYGNFAAFNQLMGYRNNDGIMHMMLVEIICQQIVAGNLQYIMYDTYFGALPGLKQFKTALGFKPYWAKYTIQGTINNPLRQLITSGRSNEKII